MLPLCDRIRQASSTISLAGCAEIHVETLRGVLEQQISAHFDRVDQHFSEVDKEMADVKADLRLLK